MSMVHIPSQSTTIPRRIGNTENPDRATLLANGWRDMGPMPVLAAGYTRLSVQWVDAGDGIHATAIVNDRPTSEIEAEGAAAEATRRATPVILDQPYEFPLVVIQSQTTGKGIGILTTDEGDLVTVEVHASPWPDKVTLRAKIDAAVAKHNALKAAGKGGVNGQIQARLEAIERALGWRS